MTNFPAPRISTSKNSKTGLVVNNETANNARSSSQNLNNSRTSINGKKSTSSPSDLEM